MARDPPPKPKRGQSNRWYEGKEFQPDRENYGEIPARDLGAGGRLVGPRLPPMEAAAGERATRPAKVGGRMMPVRKRRNVRGV